MSSAPYSDLVARHGLSPAHALLLAAVPDGSRVLDVGCATGYLGGILLERGCAVSGVEADVEAAAQAPFPVQVGDLADTALRAGLGRPFDAILCGDVLEHLSDPAATLGWLAGLLSAEGVVVVSVPNVAHWTGRRALIRGRFPQEDHGLFDRTHLRWFTRSSARALVESTGLTVVAEDFTPAPLPLQARIPALARLETRALRARPELFALQVVLTARRGDRRPGAS
ncbi:MAG: class I SAM-dependent methyltransferase [Solirubrobacterales bacterium]|nr:class I SAM-dependent methyltransferase [Solirubrobacterales bacterium]